MTPDEKEQIRSVAIALLDDDTGICEKGGEKLFELLESIGITDIEPMTECGEDPHDTNQIRFWLDESACEELGLRESTDIEQIP